MHQSIQHVLFLQILTGKEFFRKVYDYLLSTRDERLIYLHVRHIPRISSSKNIKTS